MIAGIWRCVVLSEKADRYLEHLNQFVIPAIQAAKGNEGHLVMKEKQGKLTHFLMISFWASDEALARFTGTDINLAAPSSEEKSLLITFESPARHYETT